ncbi:MAG TPA: hemerythrin domain-containing protein [candidate division Zixibacteria bacterium]|nr:hemerythrin domain-containing protein [candidate division Zixibacteria bacterium]
MGDQLDVYTGVHKGQRTRFFDIMMKAGTMDYEDEDSLDRLYYELTALREHVFLHASLEEKFIHPLLSERVPGGARKLEEDHRMMHQQFDDIVAQLDWIRARSTESEMRGRLVLEFYRGWNRFISFYFMHINEEEENVQPMLWKICTAKELDEAHKAMIASQSPEELKYDLQIMLPAMNLHERPEIFYAARVSMPPQVFQGLLKVAEQLLSSKDWAALKLEIGSD